MRSHFYMISAFSILVAPAFAQEEEQLTPNQIVDAAPAEAWIEIPADELLVVDLDGDRRTVFRLAPRFAPVHVENIRRLAGSDYWTGANVYRVQDNYVSQFGLRDIERDLPEGVVENPPAEYVFSGEGLDMVRLGTPDPYSFMAGFVDGFPVAMYEDGTASLTHCYGTLAVGRDVSPSTGSGAELYTIIGQPTRHMDRNLAIVGMAVDGIQHMAALERGLDGPLGMYAESQRATPIVSMKLASALPEADRPRYEYLSEKSDSFARYKFKRANRLDAFYTTPAGGVSLCGVGVPVRKIDD